MWKPVNRTSEPTGLKTSSAKPNLVIAENEFGRKHGDPKSEGSDPV